MPQHKTHPKTVGSMPNTTNASTGNAAMSTGWHFCRQQSRNVTQNLVWCRRSGCEPGSREHVPHTLPFHRRVGVCDQQKVQHGSSEVVECKYISRVGRGQRRTLGCCTTCGSPCHRRRPRSNPPSAASSSSRKMQVRLQPEPVQWQPTQSSRA
jgi:hypothetical protein